MLMLFYTALKPSAMPDAVLHIPISSDFYWLFSDIVYNKDSDIKCYQDSFESSGLAEKVPFKILEDSSETIVYGDVNLDGSVTIADAVLLNKYLVNSAALSDQGMTNADAYFDEKITSDDTLAILKLIVGTYNSLPINP